MTETENLLKDIKHYVEDGEMSFLIGAGFSRNVNKKAYPLWGELLKDVIWELFGSGNRARQEKKVREKAEKDYGYLGIASMMVKKAGYHEAIDTYIESKTPFLKTVDGKACLFMNGEKMVQKVNPTCHNLLKNLDIHNIYTFNYDNALEYFLGDDARKELEKEIVKQEKELVSLNEEIHNLKDNEGKLQETLEFLKKQRESTEVNDSVKQEGNDSNVEELNKQLDNTRDEIETRKKQVRDIKVNLDNNKLKFRSFYNVVKDAYEISLSSTQKTIYKIHGSLRESKDAEYGFDGDSHTQYIITQEDYDTYHERHEAFVNMMRIDLLRNRFCIMGVSGGDANFLTWINWVKDVLDKTRDREKQEAKKQHQSFFVYSGSKDMPEDMMLMLKNHYIQPVILKDLFPAGKNDEERITLFLEYLQPLRNEEASRFTDLWRGIEVPRGKYKKSKAISSEMGQELFSLSERHRFHKPQSAIHYIAKDVQFAGVYYLKDGAALPERQVYAAAMQCSMLPLDITCGMNDLGQMDKEKVKALSAVYHESFRRSVVLQDIEGGVKRVIGNDVYSRILQDLYNFKFPSIKDVGQIDGSKGIAFVRKYALYSLLGQDVTQAGTSEATDFRSLQELVLATDWLKYLGHKNPTLYSKAEDYKNQNRLFSLYDYCQAYLSAMRKKEELNTYGNVSETLYLDSFTADVTNGATLLNSFVELGICFAGHSLLTDQEWMELVKALRTRYTEALIFYTLSRGSKDKVIKLVAQEMMYDEKSRKKLGQVLKNIIPSMVADTTPVAMKAKMATFAAEILPAVDVRSWSRLFVDNAEMMLDLADQYNGYSDIAKSLYRFVADAIEFLSAKELKLRLLRRILEKETIDERFESHFNKLAISARKGLSVREFSPLNDLLIDFAKKARDGKSQQGYFIVMNLLLLVDKEHRKEVLSLLKDRSLYDAFMTDGYVAHAKDYPEILEEFKKKLLQREDLWHTGIMKDGVGIGGGNVKIGLLDRYLHYDDEEVLVIYENLKEYLSKIEKLLDREGQLGIDRGWMSSENTFREVVMDMKLFVHKHQKQLTLQDNFETIQKQLMNVYERCFFGRSIYELIADDEIYRAIRKLMLETELYGLEQYRQEYEQMIGRLITKNSNELSYLFRHLSWIISAKKSFFNTDGFKELFGAVLSIYKPYFDVSQKDIPEWNLIGCQKEIAENCLVKIAQTLKDMGAYNEFWCKYHREFKVV